MMTECLWDLYYEADFSKTVIPWKIYDTLQHNKLICENYGNLISEDTSIDEKKVVSYKLVKMTNEFTYMKVYVR